MSMANESENSTASSEILSLPVARKSYTAIHRSLKHKRIRLLHEVLEKLKMTPEDAISVLSKDIGKTESKTNTDVITTIVKSLDYAAPLSVQDAAALTTFFQFSDREIQFVRRFIGGLPALNKIRQERWKYLKTMPNMYCFDTMSGMWTEIGHGRVVLRSKKARNYSCIRIELRKALLARLQEYKSVGSMPTAPDITSLAGVDRSRTFAILLSLDSGTGTVKLMFRFLTETISQNVSEITLIAEALGTSEAFADIHAMFGSISAEILDLRENGLRINSVRYEVVTFFVADFKVLYSVTGSFGPSSKFPCPWCCTPSRYMDRTSAELSELARNRKVKDFYLNEMKSRPEVMNLEGKSDRTRLQRGGTYNIFELTRGGGEINIPSNIVPPVLHLHIGLVNKIVKALDGIVHTWNEKMQYKPEDDKFSPATQLLASSLSRCAARRENYYSGQLSGVPCTNLMKRMRAFCLLFFHRSAGTWGTVRSAIPSTTGLERDLIELSDIYTGSRFKDGNGLEFYLRSQKKWTAHTVLKWENIVDLFIQKLRKTIGRSRVCSGIGRLEHERWREPLLMPKLHSLAIHCSQFVWSHGYLGIFSEEVFEHFQQESGRIFSK